jgi:DNA-3-methyladenine glycosylase II
LNTEQKSFFSKDSKIKDIVNHDLSLPPTTKSGTLRLIASIMSQQLSVHVAKVLNERFLKLFEMKSPKAEDILAMPLEKIKSIGISQSKANYIHNVAEFMAEHKLTGAKLRKMSDQEIIDLLTEIKGIGRWTVEMLLIFGLEREDIFALDDLGVQQAMIKLFRLHDLSKKDLRIKMLKLSERWSPYRSFVCLYFWRVYNIKK